MSFVVCTRERPESLRTALRSLLVAADRASSQVGAELEILVVDQSRDARSRDVIAALRSPRLRHLWRPALRGLSAARNVGLREARGDLVLFTDDDCEADPDWALTWIRAMRAHPAVRVAFGEVRAGPLPLGIGPDVRLCTHAVHEESAGGLVRLLRRGPDGLGIGANLAVRSSPADPLVFDEGLGAGTALPAAEEIDLAYRAVRRGWRLLEVPDAIVVHHGWRSGGDARAISRGYQIGNGAMWAKHVRLADPVAPLLLGRWSMGLVRKVIRRHGRRPTGLGDLLAYARGAGRGLRTRVDHRSRCFAAPAPAGEGRVRS
ncbi:MAG: glycosyltransferase family 2 protein [Candidatus Dormibacteraeota bacterium]|nr:glycosyltransferase family 2 protein [Candidatus Dormibacteraeota bacterium]